MNKPSPQPSALLWIQIVATCLAVVLLDFFITAYFMTPNPTVAQSDLMRFLYPVLAGLIASLISGGVWLVFEIPLSREAKMTISASAGLAIFVLVYVKGPYWYPGVMPAPISSPSPTVAPVTSPSPIVARPTTAPVATATLKLPPSPAATPGTVVSALPVPTLTSRPAPSPPALSPVARAGRVLLLIEDETILQTMMQRLMDYGLRPISGHEFGDGESARIRAALPRLQAGDAAADATIPFAVVVTGKINSTPIGNVVEATLTLRATVIVDREILPESVSARGFEIREALREVAANIPELFFRRIAARAR